jgi:DNA (cytosine-5)-methyltransferase 1
MIAHALTGNGFDASEDGTGRGTPLVPATSFCLNAGAMGRCDAETETETETMIPVAQLVNGNQGGGKTCHGFPLTGPTPPCSGATGPTRSSSPGGAFDAAIPFDTTQITSKTNRSSPQAGDPCHPLASGAHAPAVAFPWQLGGTMQMSLDTEVCGSLVKNQVHAVHAVHAVRRLTPRECERLQGFPDDYSAIPGAKDGPRYKALGNSMAVPVMRWIGERIDAVDAATQEAPAAVDREG